MTTIELIPNHPTANNNDNQTNQQNNVFTFPETGQKIRIVIRNDEPWFVGQDICAVLGTKTWNLQTILEQDERRPIGNLYSIEGLKDFNGLRKDSLIITEAGFYRLILRSDKPIAKPFQRWVTHDVLPSIRKTGGYIHATPEESPEMIMAKALRVADDTIKRQRKELEAVKPIVARYNTFLNAEGTVSLTEAAKQLDMTAYQLGKMLRSNDIHWLYRNLKNTNIPTKEAIDNGYATLITCRASRNVNIITTQARITAKGMDELHFLLRK